VIVSGAQILRGVNWGHKLASGGTDATDCKPSAQFESEFKFMATYAQAVKIYSCGECLAGPQALKYGKQFGLKIFVGMTADPQWFDGDFGVFKTMQQDYGLDNVLGITIGSEDLYRSDNPNINAASIENQIKQVQAYLKGLGYGIPVTHVDAIGATDPRWGNIRAVQDIYMYNYFPFWMGTPVQGALPATIGAYNDIKANYAQGKPTWIGEVGWPTGGYNVNQAMATENDAGVYFRDFVCWANANNIPYFYYEAFDEPWKNPAVGQTGPIEANFGIYYYNNSAKSFSNSVQCNGATAVTPNPQPTNTPVKSSTTATPTPTTAQTNNGNSASTGNSNTGNSNTGAANTGTGNSGNTGNTPTPSSNTPTPTSNNTPTPTPTSQSGNNNGNSGNSGNSGNDNGGQGGVNRPQNSAGTLALGFATIAAVALLI